METCNPTQLNAHSDLAGYFSRYCSGPVCFGAACTNKSSRKQEPTAIPQQRADSKHYCYCLFAKRNCAFFFYFYLRLNLGEFHGEPPLICGDTSQLHHHFPPTVTLTLTPWPRSQVIFLQPEGVCCFALETKGSFYKYEC